MKGQIEAKFKLKQNFANSEQNHNRISTCATTGSFGGVGELHSKLEHPAGCSSLLCSFPQTFFCALIQINYIQLHQLIIELLLRSETISTYACPV